MTNQTGIQPTEFKLLVEPKSVEEVSKGGIILPSSAKDAEKYACVEGVIIAISHLAFTYATEAEWDGHKPKAGDRIIYAKHAGAGVKSPQDGKDYLLINDKDCLAVVEDVE